MNKEIHSVCRIVFLALMLFFSSREALYSAVLLDRVVAVVNKEVITWSELYKMMDYESTDQVKKMTDAEKTKIFKENEQVFLERLIDMKLQIQEAKSLNMEVSPEDIKAAVDGVKKKYSLTDAALEDSLKKEGLTIDDYKRKLSEQMLIGQVVNKQIRSKITISEDEVSRALKEGKDGKSGEESYRIRQILLKKPKEEADRNTVEEKAAAIMQRLKAGEDFSALAREYSEDSSAKRGGDLGTVQKSLIAKEFSDLLSSMKAGDISNPFWTATGLHIIKLDEKIPALTSDDMREMARRQLLETQFSERYKSWLKALREKAHIEIRL